MASKKQIAANQKNSTKSTGPKSLEGKNTASRNATQHGILSSSLILPDEDPLDFQQLFEELTDSFQPIGVLEMILVEKIAVSIWKQRRVVAAETAAVTLRRQDRQINRTVNLALGNQIDRIRIHGMSLENIEPADVSNAETVISEWNAVACALDQEAIAESDMKVKAPSSWMMLQDEARNAGTSVEQYLKDSKMNLFKWFNIHSDYAEDVIEQMTRQQRFDELYHVANAELSILPDKTRASFERYQTTLDNQLYRAIKELRQLQDRRLSMIETLPSAMDAENNEPSNH
jgi:hypothetical protein